MEQIRLYIRDSYNELVNKVTWPSWANLQSSTILVLVASIILALVIFLMDTASKSIVNLLYNING